MNIRARTAGFLAALAAFAAVSGAEQPLALETGPHLFIDDYLIDSASGIERVICPPERLPEPIITGPVDKCFQPYVTVVRDETTGRFGVWYGVPEDASQSHLAYMESADGIRWERPHQMLTDPGRIQFGASILDEGRGFAEPARRYKYGYWNDGGLQVAYSADGLTWTNPYAGPVLRHDHDINCIFRDSARKRYLAMVSSVRTGPTWKGRLRVPMQSASLDLQEWTAPHVVIAPDDQDEGETQFYCVGGLLARGTLLIGMLRVLRDDLPCDPGGPAAGIGYTVLAWSRDGERWERDRAAFMPRNPKPDTWDHAMTWADCQLIVGDEVFVYYGGYARGHKVERFSERQIGLARLKLDRYVAREAKGHGRMLTPLLIPTGTGITVNADVHGELRLRAIGRDGQAIAGFDFQQCEPLHGDSLRHRVRWKSGRLPPGVPPHRLEFELDRARVFGFAFEP